MRGERGEREREREEAEAVDQWSDGESRNEVCEAFQVGAYTNKMGRPPFLSRVWRPLIGRPAAKEDNYSDYYSRYSFGGASLERVSRSSSRAREQRKEAQRGRYLAPPPAPAPPPRKKRVYLSDRREGRAVDMVA